MDLRGRRFELLSSGISNLALAVMLLAFLTGKLFFDPGDPGRSTVATVMVALVVLVQLPALALACSQLARSLGAEKWLPTLLGAGIRIGASLWLATLIR